MSNKWIIFRRSDNSFVVVKDQSKEYEKLRMNGATCIDAGFTSRERARDTANRYRAFEENKKAIDTYKRVQTDRKQLSFLQRIWNFIKGRNK